MEKPFYEKLFGDLREMPGNSSLGKHWDCCYLMGMAGRFLPKSASKIKPSTAMNRNWEKVTMFPHPGNSLQARRDKDQRKKNDSRPGKIQPERPQSLVGWKEGRFLMDEFCLGSA